MLANAFEKGFVGLQAGLGRRSRWARAGHCGHRRLQKWVEVGVIEPEGEYGDGE
jgi:hypothetical protein